MLTQEQRRIVEWFKEQTSINIKTKDADLEIKDKICIHSIALSIQSNFTRANEKANRRTSPTSRYGRRNNGSI